MKKIFMLVMILLFCCTGCSYSGYAYFGADDSNSVFSNDSFFGENAGGSLREAKESFQSGVDYLLADYNVKETSVTDNNRLNSYDFIDSDIIFTSKAQSDALSVDDNNSKSNTKKETAKSSTKKSPARNGQPGRKLGQFVTTAYCPCRICCGANANGITASGKKARANHTVAVDKSVISLGTKIVIDGKEYVAEDTGGAIKGKRIDIFFNSHKEALQWGRRTKDVFLAK